MFTKFDMDKMFWLMRIIAVELKFEKALIAVCQPEFMDKLNKLSPQKVK